MGYSISWEQAQHNDRLTAEQRDCKMGPSRVYHVATKAVRYEDGRKMRFCPKHAREVMASAVFHAAYYATLGPEQRAVAIEPYTEAQRLAEVAERLAKQAQWRRSAGL